MRRQRRFVLLNWLRILANKLFPESVANAYSYNDMEEAMEDWLEIYADLPWWCESCHNKTLNLGATIASEFARLITIEFESEVTGSKRADFCRSSTKDCLNSLELSSRQLVLLAA